MVTTLENKIKITFEFESLKELRNLYGLLNSARVSINKRKQKTKDAKEYAYLSDCWNELNNFAEYFNPANF